jgi:hypothetical protein
MQLSDYGGTRGCSKSIGGDHGCNLVLSKGLKWTFLYVRNLYGISFFRDSWVKIEKNCEEEKVGNFRSGGIFLKMPSLTYNDLIFVITLEN